MSPARTPPDMRSRSALLTQLSRLKLAQLGSGMPAHRYARMQPCPRNHGRATAHASRRRIAGLRRVICSLRHFVPTRTCIVHVLLTKLSRYQSRSHARGARRLPAFSRSCSSCAGRHGGLASQPARASHGTWCDALVIASIHAWHEDTFREHIRRSR